MKNSIFQITYNAGVLSAYDRKLFHCVAIENFPKVKAENVLYYIEIEILKSQQSKFNDTMFHDVNITLWNDLETLKPLKQNGWELKFVALPKGLGTDKLVYAFIDPHGQELVLKRHTDTRNFSSFCEVIALIILQFEKASSLTSLNHHLGI